MYFLLSFEFIVDEKICIMAARAGRRDRRRRPDVRAGVQNYYNAVKAATLEVTREMEGAPRMFMASLQFFWQCADELAQNGGDELLQTVIRDIERNSRVNQEYEVDPNCAWMQWTEAVRGVMGHVIPALGVNRDHVRAELAVAPASSIIWGMIVERLREESDANANGTNPAEYAAEARGWFINFRERGVWNGPDLERNANRVVSGVKAMESTQNTPWALAVPRTNGPSFLRWMDGHLNARYDAHALGLITGLLYAADNVEGGNAGGEVKGRPNAWSTDYLAMMYLLGVRLQLDLHETLELIEPLSDCFHGAVGQTNVKARIAMSEQLRGITAVLSVNENKYQHPGNITIHRLRTVCCHSVGGTEALENCAIGGEEAISRWWINVEALCAAGAMEDVDHADINTVTNIAHRYLQGQTDIAPARQFLIGSVLQVRIVALGNAAGINYDDMLNDRMMDIQRGQF